jgi:hypothetical protein
MRSKPLTAREKQIQQESTTSTMLATAAGHPEDHGDD